MAIAVQLHGDGAKRLYSNEKKLLVLDILEDAPKGEYSTLEIKAAYTGRFGQISRQELNTYINELEAEGHISFRRDKNNPLLKYVKLVKSEQ